MFQIQLVLLVSMFQPPGETALHLLLRRSENGGTASSSDRLKIFTMLLEMRASPNATDHDGRSVLGDAIRCKNVEALASLVRHGARASGDRKLMDFVDAGEAMPEVPRLSLLSWRKNWVTLFLANISYSSVRNPNFVPPKNKALWMGFVEGRDYESLLVHAIGYILLSPSLPFSRSHFPPASLFLFVNCSQCITSILESQRLCPSVTFSFRNGFAGEGTLEFLSLAKEILRCSRSGGQQQPDLSIQCLKDSFWTVGSSLFDGCSTWISYN